jgi:hypothetical protein
MSMGQSMIMLEKKRFDNEKLVPDTCGFSAPAILTASPPPQLPLYGFSHGIATDCPTNPADLAFSES